MKEFLFSIFIFALLAIGFSGCTPDTNSQKAATDDTTVETGDPANAEAKPRNSGYPPLVDKVAQAELSHLDGSTSKIADSKGKVVLLNMWATWCGPCRSEMPTLVRLQEDLGSENINVIGLNADEETVDVINPFKDAMKLNYTLVWPPEGTLNELMRISKQTVIPQSFVVDREGKLRGVFIGANPREVKKMDKLIRQIAAE